MNQRPYPGNQRPHSGGGGYGSPPLPRECVFDSFYGQDGYLKKAIFLEGAQKAAEYFEREGMSQTSFRALFNMLKAVEQRMRTEKMPQGGINEAFLRFIRHVQYQNKRGIIKEGFKKFVDEHQNVVLDNSDEFKGFVEYLASILARMKMK